MTSAPSEGSSWLPGESLVMELPSAILYHTRYVMPEVAVAAREQRDRDRDAAFAAFFDQPAPLKSGGVSPLHLVSSHLLSSHPPAPSRHGCRLGPAAAWWASCA
jgi:hypothetical protein